MKPDIIALCNLRPNMKSVSVRFIVLDKGEKKRTKEGRVVAEFVVADGTGSVSFNAWDQLVDQLLPGDIILLVNGRPHMFKGSMYLATTKLSTVTRCGDFTMVFKEEPNMTKTQWTQDSRGFHPVFTSASVPSTNAGPPSPHVSIPSTAHVPSHSAPPESAPSSHHPAASGTTPHGISNRPGPPPATHTPSVVSRTAGGGTRPNPAHVHRTANPDM
eukprot:Rmarinus@m.10078